MATLTTLISFNVGTFSPCLVADAAGDLFGTTTGGGASGDGTVFEIAKTGTGYASAPTTLFSFNGEPSAVSLIVDAAGNLFGTTKGGGATDNWGRVFEIARTSAGFASTPTTLVSFDVPIGVDPISGLIADSAGNLFSTTGQVEVSGGKYEYYSTVFEITKTGSDYASTPTTLANFNFNGHGEVVTGGLIFDAAGDLFGTTVNGGADNYGTVFEIANTSTGYASTPTTLATFNGTDGEIPQADLIMDAAGNLFGTTQNGGANDQGSVFEIAKTSTGYASTPETLFSSNGEALGTGLIVDAASDLFVTAALGGSPNYGRVFEITKTAGGYASTPTTLISFNGPNGANPQAGLTADAAGDLFGTTVAGGTKYYSTVYELTNTGFQVTAINLPTGNNTVTLTDTTFSHGPLTIRDGAGGNNTISAAGDTAASAGKSLTYVTGMATDVFAGGFENDTVLVSAAAVGGDSLTGGSGINTLVLTSAGSVNLGGVSNFARIQLASGNNTVTVTDNTLSGGSVTIAGGAGGNNSISAADDTTASQGKSLAYVVGTGPDNFAGGFEDDFVHVRAAALGSDTLTGGSGANALVLTSTGDVALGAVSNFTAIDLFAGNNAVTLTDTTLFGGFVALHAAASGNTSVNAAGDTTASVGKDLTYVAGTGTDSFTGGFENDTVRVSAAVVGGDTLIGGSGTNTLALLSAGTVNLGGVSRFVTIDLRAGNNTVTVTDTTLSSRRTAIRDAASGDTSISAAGDTAASTGHRLTFFAGAGTDSFTGGFENDTIYAGTGLGTYTAGSGTDRFVFIQDNLPNQTLDNFHAGSDDILLYGIHASDGFDLGATDNALNPTSPAAIDPSIFITNASGDFTSSDQRFAYDTSNGQLFYSATGSDTSESLVATLTGEPAITAGNLFFLH